MRKMSLNDTIAAISTPIGPGGIGIIRISGPDAVPLAARLLGREKASLEVLDSHSIFYAKILEPRTGVLLDECLISIMRGPRSYTREDVVEINVHSGLPTLKMVLKEIVGLGARLAEPGEFTKRAFLAGRMDLMQAQAVGALVRARTETAAKAAARQAQGHQSIELESIRAELIEVVAELEAAVDFSDEDIDPLSIEAVTARVAAAGRKLDRLCQMGRRGRVYDLGVRTVIVGRPNVGKSCLLNALSREDRAIVSAQPGTTRDIVESSVLLGDIPLLLQDTAGWRSPGDDIEAQGINRGKAALSNADLVILVLDGSEELTHDDLRLFENLETDVPLVIAVNKSDLSPGLTRERLPVFLTAKPLVYLSALRGEGVGELEERVGEVLGISNAVEGDEIMMADLRQMTALGEARANLLEVEQAAALDMGEEVLAPLLKEAIRLLSTMTREDLNKEVLDKIFSSFCIGK